MKARSGAFAAVLLWFTWPASAHRLDEFLQATTIAVERGQVTVQMRLTPGVAVVRTMLPEIDTDDDGLISGAEQDAYVERVLHALSLRVDGYPLQPRVVSSTFPSVEEIKAGMGDILLTLRADVPPGGLDRRLIFENHYRGAMAAYLVNCLFPDDPGIRVIAQSRNYEQSFYQVDYRQDNVRPNSPPAGSGPIAQSEGNRPAASTQSKRIIPVVFISALSAAGFCGLSLYRFLRRSIGARDKPHVG